MNILIAHNRYQHRGGEDSVVDAEAALLRENGHDVLLYHRDNDELPGMGAADVAASVLWCRRTGNDISTLCRHFQPDVIHAHNTFPLISPSLYWAAARCGVPMIQSLHNFRLLCPQAILLRDGNVCEQCIGKLPWRAVRYRCYRDHALQSAATAAMLALHRMAGSYRKRVTRYITLNAYCRDKFIAGGLPPEKLCIKPNFIDVPALTAGPIDGLRNSGGGLYIGRLSKEKGIEVLLRAHGLTPSVPVDVIGDGPLQATTVAHFGLRAHGFMPLPEVLARMQAARYLLVPSICHETAPRTIVEAYACGLPVIASRLGSLAAMVRDGLTGLLFDPGNAVDLAEKMRWANAHPHAMAQMGRAARTEYEQQYTPQRNYRMLMTIYQAAIHTPHPASAVVSNKQVPVTCDTGARDDN